MEDMDKAVEIMKAAMEKEKVMKEKQDEKLDQQIDKEDEQEEDFEDNVDFSEDDLMTEDIGSQVENGTILSDDMKTSGSAQEKDGKSGKGFFKNMKSSKDFAAKDQKIAELSDRVLRNMAEFDNFRKRSEKEKSMMYDMGVRSMVEKILPVVDSFERGFSAITEDEKGSAFAQGIEMIYRQLVTSLDEIGVKPIDAVGKEFDPNLHHAVMHGEDDNLGENVVSDEFQKGYIYRDMVVRHSMVKVVN